MFVCIYVLNDSFIEYPYGIFHCLSHNECKNLFLCLFVSREKGASGVGIGNFEEVGPLDTDLKPRNSTWLQKADLLFVVSDFWLIKPSY